MVERIRLSLNRVKTFRKSSELRWLGGRDSAPKSRRAKRVGQRCELRAVRPVRTGGLALVGAIGPEPHPSFIEVSCDPPFRDGHWEVARAGKDGPSL